MLKDIRAGIAQKLVLLSKLLKLQQLLLNKNVLN